MEYLKTFLSTYQLRLTIFSVLFQFSNIIPGVYAYNLDTDIPIIKTGPTNSYFGFSVAQHLINHNGIRNSNSQPMILVGAPLSDYAQVKVQKPGAVYKCPITARMDDCVRLKIDDDLPPDKDENRNNQWLGVVVKSQENGDSVVACGHRYSRSGTDYHWGFGICYSLTSNLEYEDVYSPCIGRPVFKAHQQFGYCQAGTSLHLASNDDILIGAPGSYTWTGSLFKNNIATGIFADKRWFFTPLEAPDTVPVHHYSFLGMSSYAGHFKGVDNHDLDGGSADLDRALTFVGGAPRTNGSGCVVMFDKRASNTFSSTLVPTLTLKGLDILGQGFGYAVEGIDINADGYLDLAVGAPFYYDTKDETVGGAVYIFLNGPKGLNVTNPVFLTGKSDSMFGYSIAAIGDINQDGYRDLAIGAPKTDKGIGAVYIYHGGPEALISRENTKLNDHEYGLADSEDEAKMESLNSLSMSLELAQVITPLNLRYTETPTKDTGQSIFGSDSDYLEENSDGNSLTGLGRHKKRDVIDYSEFKPDIRTFGHSISGGIDMDNNGYPDVLIGTYQSDKVFLFRSRPIVNIYTEVRELPNAIDPLNPNSFPCPASIRNINSTTVVYLTPDRKKRVDICFPIKVCFRFSAHPTSYFTSKLQIQYTLTAEKFGLKHKRLFSRIKFLNQNQQRPGFPTNQSNQLNHMDEDGTYKMIKILDLSPQVSHQYICDISTAYLKPDTKDFLRPINFEVMVNLTDKVPEQLYDDPLININTYPILNQDTSIKTFQVQFLKDCGVNELCESDLQLESSLIISKGSKSNEYLMTLGQNKYIGLHVSIENFGEAAYETELFIHFSKRVNYVGVKLPSTGILNLQQNRPKSYSCSLFNDTLIRCEIGNPFKADGKVDFIFNFDVSSLKLEHNNITFNVNVTTTSSDRLLHPKNQTLTALIIIKSEMSIAGVSSPEQIFYGGFVKGESAMTNEIDVGNLVEHRYMINNNGPGTISSTFVDIAWPFEVENKRNHGKWLLYMTRYPWVDGKGVCEVDPMHVNALKLKLQPRSLMNVKPQKHLKKKKVFPTVLANKALTQIGRYKRAIERAYRAIESKLMKRELIILPEPQIIAGKLRNVVNMDCQKGTAKCFEIHCEIGELAPHESVVIHLRGRLWNSTFIEDYAKMDAISIISRANLTIDKKFNVEQNTSNDFAFVETLAYPDIDILTEFREMEPWIIIVSICLGIFLFFIIAILLWKVGFFKRNKFKPPYSAKLEKIRYDDEMNDL